MPDTLATCEGVKWYPRVVVEKYSKDQTAYAERQLRTAMSWGRRVLVERLGLFTRELHGDFLRELFPGGPEDGYAYDEGNILVAGGLQSLIGSLLTGTAASGVNGRALANATCGIGVGATATAATVADAALGANGASAWYQQQDATFPSWAGSGTANGGQLNGQVTVASGNGNFAWNEWCWFTFSAMGTAGATLASVATNPLMINHKVPASSLGTKASGASWVFSNTVTFS